MTKTPPTGKGLAALPEVVRKAIVTSIATVRPRVVTSLVKKLDLDELRKRDAELARLVPNRRSRPRTCRH